MLSAWGLAVVVLASGASGDAALLDLSAGPRMRCGADSLFVALTHLGRTVDYLTFLDQCQVSRGRKGNGMNFLMLTDGHDTPLSAIVTAANVNEVHAIEALVDECRTAQRPQRLVYDKAADADWLRQNLAARGMELIAPHRANRTRTPLQDGRALRRYKCRYRIERTISWLHRCRRLITRWEWYPDLFEGFVHLAGVYTILQKL